MTYVLLSSPSSFWESLTPACALLSHLLWSEADFIWHMHSLHHCKNVTSVAVWIPSMQWPTSFCHWCYHDFSVTPNVQARFLEKKALQMKFIFVLERAIFMYCWMNSEIFMHNGQTFGQYSCTFTQVFIPYWNFEYTKAVTVHCGKSGRWYGVWYYNWSDSPLG